MARLKVLLTSAAMTATLSSALLAAQAVEASVESDIPVAASLDAEASIDASAIQGPVDASMVSADEPSVEPLAAPAPTAPLAPRLRRLQRKTEEAAYGQAVDLRKVEERLRQNDMSSARALSGKAFDGYANGSAHAVPVAELIAVRRLAYRLSRRLPSEVLVQDLISAGYEGLARARRRVKPGELLSKGYLTIRVCGAMIDELRSNDWLGRRGRDFLNRIDRTIGNLTGKLGRPPEESEIALELGLSVDAYRKKLKKFFFQKRMPFDTSSEEIEGSEIFGKTEETPEDTLIHVELHEAVGRLPRRLQVLLKFRYSDALSDKEIAAIFGVSKPRISQLHAKAIKLLRAFLSEETAD